MQSIPEAMDVDVNESVSADALLAAYKVLKTQVAEMEKMTRLFIKAQKSVQKLQGKQKRERKGSFPKGETPVHVAEWNATVQSTLEDMRANGWSEHKTGKGVVLSGSTKNESGVFVYVSSGKAPTYKGAMSLASYRKGESKQVVPVVITATAVAVPVVVVEKESTKVAEKAVKAAEKAEEKAKKESEKAAKASEKAEEKAKKESEKAAKASEKAAKASAKASEKAAKASAKESKSVTKGAETSVVVKDETVSEDATTWVFRNQVYIRTTQNECWLANDDGSMGQWVGIYDPVVDKIDETAEEPELEL